MQNKRAKVIPKNQDFVHDNKVSGGFDSILKQQEQILKKAEKANRETERTAILMREASERLVKQITSLEPDKRLDGKSDNAKVVKDSIVAGLTVKLSSEKAERLANKFVQDASNRNIATASENLSKNFAKESRRFSGVKVKAFESKARATSLKQSKSSIVERMIATGKIAPKKPQKTSQEVKDNDFSKSVLDYSSEISKRNMIIRQMRRKARDLKVRITRKMYVDRANNGVSFNDIGARNASIAHDKIMESLNIFDNIEGVNCIKDLNIDSLLQKGQSSMMYAKGRTTTLHRHLIKQREQDQQRVRS